MRRLSAGSLTLLLALGGCGSIESHRAQVALVGTNVPDLFSCAGPPATTRRISEAEWLAQWQFKADDPALKVSIFTQFDLTVGGSGGCNMTARIKRPGYLVVLHYTGDTMSIDGPQSACAPIIRSCLERADKTTLPEGYDLDRWMSTPKP